MNSKLSKINSLLGIINYEIRSHKFADDLLSDDSNHINHLTNRILKLSEWMDDSISNPYIGNIFDRKEDSPINNLLTSIAEIYNVSEAFISTNGTSPLNTAAVFSLADENDQIIIGRDAHVSVHAGVTLSGARPVYIAPKYDHELGVLRCVTPASVEATLNKSPKAKAVVLTLPTYHGLMGNVQAIREICHEYNTYLMIDEAHGPHFHLLQNLKFPMSAEAAGADIVTQSTHKVLPRALNQGSIALFNNQDLFHKFEEITALGFQSTSFSYLIFMSIENALYEMLNNGQAAWEKTIGVARYFVEEASSIKGVRVLKTEEVVDGEDIIGLDPTRITLNIQGTGLSGYEICKRLVSEAGIIPEMATKDVLLFLVSPEITKTTVLQTIEWIERILTNRGKNSVMGLKCSKIPSIPQQALTPRKAYLNQDRERVPISEAVGRTSVETIGCYPPGTAIICAGEVITAQAVNFLRDAVAAGGHLKRANDDNFKTILVSRS